MSVVKLKKLAKIVVLVAGLVFIAKPLVIEGILFVCDSIVDHEEEIMTWARNMDEKHNCYENESNLTLVRVLVVGGDCQ